MNPNRVRQVSVGIVWFDLSDESWEEAGFNQIGTPETSNNDIMSREIADPMVALCGQMIMLLWLKQSDPITTAYDFEVETEVSEIMMSDGTVDWDYKSTGRIKRMFILKSEMHACSIEKVLKPLLRQFISGAKLKYQNISVEVKIGDKTIAVEKFVQE